MKTESTIRKEMARLWKTLDTPGISTALYHRVFNSYYALEWAVSNERLMCISVGEVEEEAANEKHTTVVHSH